MGLRYLLDPRARQTFVLVLTLLNGNMDGMRGVVLTGEPDTVSILSATARSRGRSREERFFFFLLLSSNRFKYIYLILV